MVIPQRRPNGFVSLPLFGGEGLPFVFWDKQWVEAQAFVGQFRPAVIWEVLFEAFPLQEAVVNVLIEEGFPVFDVLLAPLHPLHAFNDVSFVPFDQDEVSTRHEVVDNHVGGQGAGALTHNVFAVVCSVEIDVFYKRSIEVVSKDSSSNCCTASLWPCNDDWTVHDRLCLKGKRGAL